VGTVSGTKGHSKQQAEARSVEDVLARRPRALFLNARAALEMGPTVADLMAPELGWSESSKAKQVSAFRQVAAKYLLQS
jgi:glycerol-3-phosphate dehydrogenase